MGYMEGAWFWGGTSLAFSSSSVTKNYLAWVISLSLIFFISKVGNQKSLTHSLVVKVTQALCPVVVISLVKLETCLLSN